jgi:hypothetical protein
MKKFKNEDYSHKFLLHTDSNEATSNRAAEYLRQSETLARCQIGPESRNGTQKGFTVAEIIEFADKMEATSNLLAASEIAVSDSRYDLFFVFAGDQGCQSGLELETGLGCCQQLPRKRMHKHLRLPRTFRGANRVSEFQPDPHLLCFAPEKYFAYFSTANDYF